MSALSRLLNWLRPVRSTNLVWRCQHASFTPIRGTPLLHYANTESGALEVFEGGVSYLLHFPRRMGMPAEIFHSLGDAKARASEVHNRSAAS